VVFNDPVPERRNLLVLTLLIHAWHLAGASPPSEISGIPIEHPARLIGFVWLMYFWYLWQWISLEKCFWTIDGKAKQLTFLEDVNYYFQRYGDSRYSKTMNLLRHDILGLIHTYLGDTATADDDEYLGNTPVVNEYLQITPFGTSRSALHEWSYTNQNRQITFAEIMLSVPRFENTMVVSWARVQIPSEEKKSIKSRWQRTVSKYFGWFRKGVIYAFLYDGDSDIDKSIAEPRANIPIVLQGALPSRVVRLILRETILRGKYFSRILIPTLVALSASIWLSKAFMIWFSNALGHILIYLLLTAISVMPLNISALTHPTEWL